MAQRHVPADHLLRSIDRFAELGELNLAYRWFCGLGLDCDVPVRSKVKTVQPIRWKTDCPEPNPELWCSTCSSDLRLDRAPTSKHLMTSKYVANYVNLSGVARASYELKCVAMMRQE